MKLVEQGSNNLERYIEEISKAPILTEEEEYKYAKLKEQGDVNAAKMLVTSHLRLVVKIANKYRSYGLSMMDLISEGNIGLMKAVKEFSIDKGYRLTTYAIWWIRASIQEYILKSWSLVKIGTTINQRKLFFNLRKIKNRIISSKNGEQTYLNNNDIKYIANYLNVKEDEVIEMDKRLYNSEVSINSPLKNSEDSEKELSELLPAKIVMQDVLLDNKREREKQIMLLNEAIEKVLNERERDILYSRRLREKPMLLKELSDKYSITQERVRQIEETAVNKIIKYIEKNKKIALINNSVNNYSPD